MLKRIISSGLLFSLAIGGLILPSLTFAAVGTPTNLTLVGGTPTIDNTPTFTWSPVTGATWYDFQIDTRVYDAISNTLSVTLFPLSVGQHTFRVRAHNYVSEISSEAIMNFEVVNDSTTYNHLVVPAVSPSSTEEDQTTTIYVYPYSDVDVTFCDLYVNGDDKGGMQDYVSRFEKTYTFTSDGSYTVYARCGDAHGEVVNGDARTITVYADYTDELYVPTVTPSSATEDVAITLKVAPTSSVDVTYCDLYVNGSDKGGMLDHGSYFDKSYTFTDDGTYSVYARCVDAHGANVNGASRTVTVYAPTVYGVTDDVRVGELIKTPCLSGAGVNDPCKAVYYWGEDGERHAFPNEDVFYGWYTDFDDVIEVSTSTMSSLPMGHNVTIKPGTAVVKFATSDAVYAVSEGGILHHYLSPSLVASDYGSDWSSHDLVVISDVFYGNYSIGSVIDNSSDYDPATAENGVTSIDDNF